MGPLAEARLHPGEHQGQSEATLRSIRPSIPIDRALELFGPAWSGKQSPPFPLLVLSCRCDSKGHLLFAGANHFRATLGQRCSYGESNIPQQLRGACEEQVPMVEHRLC